VTAAGFRPQAPRGHERDSRYGKAFAFDLGAMYTPPVASDHLYVIGGAGAYEIRGTWLTAVNTIDPYHNQTVFGVETGVGATFGERSRWFLEARHHLAFRPIRGFARFVPVTLGYRF
jgi:hypothetical protein